MREIPNTPEISGADGRYRLTRLQRREVEHFYQPPDPTIAEPGNRRARQVLCLS
jgi:hypothetical protein